MSTFFNKILNTTCRIEESSSESENESEDSIEDKIDIINDKNDKNKNKIENERQSKIENNNNNSNIINNNIMKTKTKSVLVNNINNLKETALEKLNIFLNDNKIRKEDKAKGVQPTHTSLHPGGS